METAISRRQAMHAAGTAVVASSLVAVVGMPGLALAQDSGSGQGIASGTYAIYDEFPSSAGATEVWSLSGNPADVELHDLTPNGICAGSSEAYLDGVTIVVPHSGDQFGETLGLDSGGTLESAVLRDVVFVDENGSEILRIDGELTITITAG